MEHNSQHPDQHDEALADAMYLAPVKVWYDGVAHFSRRRVVDGVITDVRTLRDGSRELLVKIDGVNIPKAIHERDFVCYVWNNGAANQAAEAAQFAA